MAVEVIKIINPIQDVIIITSVDINNIIEITKIL
jgi:hypothetical protein